MRKIYYFIIKRLLMMIPVVLGILTLVFIISHIIPSDPLAVVLGPDTLGLTTEMRAKLMHEYGLDKPLYEQLFTYFIGLFHGDLGKSTNTGHAIIDDIKTKLPISMELAVYAMIIAIGIGIPLGIISAVKKDTLIDHFSRISSLLGIAMPSFFLALVLIFIFYYKLSWLPPLGRIDIYEELPRTITGFITLDALLVGNIGLFFNSLKHIILPSFCIGYRASAVISRMARSSMLEVMNLDYIRTARAKGLTERIVIMRHAFKNAMIPTITISGITFGAMLGGSVLVETVFMWPGLGYYATNALIWVDYQAVMAVTLIYTLIYSFTNLIVDILYFILDPKIKL